MDPKIEEKIKTILTKKVREMIIEAREKSKEVEDAWPGRLKVSENFIRDEDTNRCRC